MTYRPHTDTDYDSYAPTYAWARVAVPWILEPLGYAAGSLAAGSSVLELGCGTGNYIGALAADRAHLTMTGLDLSAPMLRQARNRGIEALLVQADAAATPFRSRSFHLAFAVDVIHHVADLGRFFAECARLLHHDGRLIIVTDSRENMARRSLFRHFPEIRELEERRYPTLDMVADHAGAAKLRLTSEELAEGFIGYTDDFMRSLEARCSSALRLLSDEVHAAGMARVRQARARGEQWRSSYTLLTYRK